MNPHRVFFASGLRFQCRQCGACCTGDPGTVYLDPAEAQRIAEHLQIPLRLFLQRFAYPFRTGYSLQEDREGNCLFYLAGCTIYTIRPLQCRAFPFWVRNLRTESRWKEVAEQCPGIGTGPLYPPKEIMEWLRRSPI